MYANKKENSRNRLFLFVFIFVYLFGNISSIEYLDCNSTQLAGGYSLTSNSMIIGDINNSLIDGRISTFCNPILAPLCTLKNTTGEGMNIRFTSFQKGVCRSSNVLGNICKVYASFYVASNWICGAIRLGCALQYGGVEIELDSSTYNGNITFAKTFSVSFPNFHTLNGAPNFLDLSSGQRNMIDGSDAYNVHGSRGGSFGNKYKLHHCPNGLQGSCGTLGISTAFTFIGIGVQSEGIYSEDKQNYFLSSGRIGNFVVPTNLAILHTDTLNTFQSYPTIRAMSNCMEYIKSGDDEILIVGTEDSKIMILNITDARNQIDIIYQYDFTEGYCCFLKSHFDDPYVFYALFSETITATFRIDTTDFLIIKMDEPESLMPRDDKNLIMSLNPTNVLFGSRIRITGWNHQILLIDAFHYDPFNSSNTISRTYAAHLKNGLDSPTHIPGYDPFGFGLDLATDTGMRNLSVPQIEVNTKNFKSWDSNVFLSILSPYGYVLNSPPTASSWFPVIWSQSFCGSGQNDSYSYPSVITDYDPVCDIKNWTSCESCCDTEICEIIPLPYMCRNSTGICDEGAMCTNSSILCPPNEPKPPTFKCGNSTGPCDEDAYCTLGNSTCPPNEPKPPTFKCGNSTGPCDEDAYCTLGNSTCPENEPKPIGTVCANATVDCQSNSTCNGTLICPPNPIAPPETPCGSQFPNYTCLLSQTCDIFGQCNNIIPKEPGTKCNADGQECSLSECDDYGICRVIEDDLCPPIVIPTVNSGSIPKNPQIANQSNEIIWTVIISTFSFMVVFSFSIFFISRRNRRRQNE